MPLRLVPTQAFDVNFESLSATINARDGVFGVIYVTLAPDAVPGGQDTISLDLGLSFLDGRSQEHDLLVVGQAPGDRGDRALLHRILKSTSRPAVVFPKRTMSGSSIVVGYDGRRQAARALSSLAASGLGIYRMIHVVTCHADVAEATSICGAACRFLARHGLDAAAHPEDLNRPPVTTLLESIGRYDAGLLVLGAYGRSSVREFLFGSTARTLLLDPPLPILLDH